MAETSTRVGNVLSWISANCDREMWWRIAAGVHEALGPDGFAVFDNWSKDGATYDLSACRSTYMSFVPRGGDGINFNTVVWHAQQQGYDPHGDYKPPSPEQRAANDAKAVEAAKKWAIERQARADKARERGVKMWKEGLPATADYPYLRIKGIQPHGARVGKWEKRFQDGSGKWQSRIIENVLLLKIVDGNGMMHGVQGITVEGEKMHLPGVAKVGHFILIKGEPGVPGLDLSEGFATGASIREATGVTTLACMDDGNIMHVAKDIHAAGKASGTTIGADNDTDTEGEGKGNPGMQVAFEVGRMFGMKVAIPPPGCDFNDLAQQQGKEAIVAAFEAALVPTAAYAPTKPPVDATCVKSSAETHGEPDNWDKTRSLPSPTPIAAAALMFRPADMLPANLPKSADARDGSPHYFALTEKGNSYRLANAHGQDIRFVTDLNQFLFWSDGRWTPDHGDLRVRSAIGRLPKAIREEATEHVCNSPDDATYALKWAQKSEAASTIGNTVTLLKDIGELHVRFQQIDANPLLVGFDGGRKVVDLRDGAVRDARRADLVTRSLGVNAVGSSSEAVLWRNFLAQVFSDDVELIDYMQRWIGYSLTGCYTEQMFLFLQGAGANGKSVLVRVLRALFGGYGAVVAAGTLMEQQRTGKEASPDVLGMAGARILLASEVAQNEAFDERFLKGWTGGDLQKARALHGKNVDFEPVGKLMIAGNHRPRIVGTDPAVWRRVRLVPFKRQFSEAERDPTLTDRLIAELPHIAAWAVAGCLEWRRRGLADTPKTVKIASADYAKEQDTLGEFLHERTDEGGECTTHDLFGEYKHWAEACNIRAISRQAFGRKLGERGFTLKHTRNGSVAENISLRRRPF
jgi:putative DNA primase/helicase